jgi:aminopeptidase N
MAAMLLPSNRSYAIHHSPFTPTFTFMKQLLILLGCFLSLSVSAQRNIDVQHYKYELELSDLSDAITGKAVIRVSFLAPASQFVLDLASVEEDKGMQAFMVLEVGNAKPLMFVHRNDQLVINLNKPAAAKETRSFEIQYMGTPKDGLIISKNMHGDRTFFADNWPDRAHQWIPCNDTPSDKSAVDFIVTAPAHYRVISNGLLQSEEVQKDGRRRTHWKEELSIPTKVMVIGAARFAVARVDSSYSIPVTAWVYPQDSAKGVYDYALGDDILKFFTSYVGPYPYKKLANVQSKTIFGGMENANAIFYAENTVTGTRRSEALMAHEIVHQWFGNTATEKSFSHLWLSEGFATYLTDIYIEQKYGIDSFQNRMQQEKMQVIKFALENELPVVDTLSSYMDLLNANSYQKGAWVLHMLRQEVGNKNFQKIIQTYYSQYQHSNADTRDFQRVAEAVAGRDLAWFFDQWLYQPGIPVLKMEMKLKDNELKIEINQDKHLFRFPLEVMVVEEDGETTTHRIEVKGRETEFKLKTKGPVKVSFDPERKLLYHMK